MRSLELDVELQAHPDRPTVTETNVGVVLYATGPSMADNNPPPQSHVRRDSPCGDAHEYEYSELDPLDPDSPGTEGSPVIDVDVVRPKVSIVATDAAYDSPAP